MYLIVRRVAGEEDRPVLDPVEAETANFALRLLQEVLPESEALQYVMVPRESVIRSKDETTVSE